jgi:hypothetical protein
MEAGNDAIDAVRAGGPILRLPPSFAPRQPRARRRTSRRGQAIEHGPGTTRSHHISRSPIRSSLVMCDLASHVAKRKSRMRLLLGRNRAGRFSRIRPFTEATASRIMAIMSAGWVFLSVLGAPLAHGPVLRADLAPGLKRPISTRLFGENKTWRGALVMTGGTVTRDACSAKGRWRRVCRMRRRHMTPHAGPDRACCLTEIDPGIHPLRLSRSPMNGPCPQSNSRSPARPPAR